MSCPVYSHRESVPFDWLYELCNAKTGLEKIAPLNQLRPLRQTFPTLPEIIYPRPWENIKGPFQFNVLYIAPPLIILSQSLVVAVQLP